MHRVHWTAFPQSIFVLPLDYQFTKLLVSQQNNFPNLGICEFKIMEGICDSYDDMKKYILNNMHFRFDRY